MCLTPASALSQQFKEVVSDSQLVLQNYSNVDYTRPKVRFPSIPHGHWGQIIWVYTVFLLQKIQVHPQAGFHLSSLQRSKFEIVLWWWRAGDGAPYHILLHPAWEWGTSTNLLHSPSFRDRLYKKVRGDWARYSSFPTLACGHNLIFPSPVPVVQRQKELVRRMGNHLASERGEVFRLKKKKKKRNIIEFCENK